MCTLGLSFSGHFRVIHLFISFFTKRAVANNCERRSLSENLFGAYLLTDCAYSKTEHEPQRRRANKRRAYVTHKPVLQRLQQVAIVCFLVFVFLFPHAKNCAFIFLTHTQVRLFLTCGSPCVCSTRMRGTVLRKPPRRRSGIIRGRYLSMRVPPVFPASDGQFCRESTLYEWWKKYRHGPERWGNSI